MTDKEYKQKKRECLLDFCREYDYKITPSVERVFGCAFDRAYALGKQEAKQEPNSSQNGNTSNYSGNHFADVSNMFDTRLHIAAMAMQGILANSHQEMVDMGTAQVAELAIEAADDLIAECEEGGDI